MLLPRARDIKRSLWLDFLLFQSCRQLQEKLLSWLQGLEKSSVWIHVSFLIQDDQLTEIHYFGPEINWGNLLISLKLDLWKFLILPVSWVKTNQRWRLISFLPNFSSAPLQARVNSALGVPFICVVGIDLSSGLSPVCKITVSHSQPLLLALNIAHPV